ncbi:xanthine dehydrogenase accessory protein XdhC [Dongia sp.]|uniref:xanthine dehydrogenase accessory protein XdhC n=1 Tax=Dongia sp. TaxID=1977262 RepID=UPI0035B22A74
MSARPADTVLSAAFARVARGRPAMLVTIAAARGSTPRVPGTRMLVDADEIVGSVGGGRLEFEIIVRARTLLSQGIVASACEHFILGPDLRQCCGGALDIVLEPLTPDSDAWLQQAMSWEREGQFWESRLAIGAPSAARTLSLRAESPPEPGSARLCKSGDGVHLVETSGMPWPQLYLFGAGHVGRALVRLLGDLPFHVVWSDARDGIFPDTIPGNVAADAGGQMMELIKTAPADAHFLVMTHSHALDFELVAAILAKGSFAGLGLIGSDTKKARFLQRLRELDIPEARLARLQCPVGIPGIKSKIPAAIAVAVAADLLVQVNAVTGVQMAG